MLAWLAAIVVVALASVVLGGVGLVPALVFAVRFAGVADGFRWVRAAVRLGVRLDGGAALLAIDLHVAALLGLRITAVEAFKQVSSSMAPALAASDTCGSTSCRCTGATFRTAAREPTAR